MKLIKDLGFVAYKWDEKYGYMRKFHKGIFECPICKRHLTLNIRDGERTKACSQCKSTTQSVHGQSRSKLYHVWCAIKQRCLNPNNDRYHRYGGRGIKLCDKWLTWEGFFEDNKDRYQEGLTIDRIDNDGNYTLENTQWISHTENSVKHAYSKNIAVLQFALDKVKEHHFKVLKDAPIGEYESITQASIATKVNLQHIADCIAGARKSAGMFYWCSPQNAHKIPNTIFKRESRPIRQMTLDGVEIAVWDTAYQAEQAIEGVKHELIAKVCRGKRKSHAGFKWAYIEE